MLRIVYSRPQLLHYWIRNTRLCTGVGIDHCLSTETLPVRREPDGDHQRRELSASHNELLGVLVHRSSQLQSSPPSSRSGSSEKAAKKAEARNRVRVQRKSSNENVKSDRIKKLAKEIKLPSMKIDPLNFNLEKELKDEENLGEESMGELSLAPSLEEIALIEEDKTLTDILSNLNSNKIRRIHKYTDEQLNFMHRHSEYNRMLLAYVDVSIFNGKLNRIRRFFDDLLVDQERRKSMKKLNWRYVSDVNIYNRFFFAYADLGNLSALQNLFEKMRNSQIKANLESYAACLICLGKMDLFDPKIARRMIIDLENNDFRVVDIFKLDCLNHIQIQQILKVLKTFRADFEVPIRSSDVENSLLTKIYASQAPKLENPENSWWQNLDTEKKIEAQLQIETEQKVTVQSINEFPELDKQLKATQTALFKDLEDQLTIGFLTELAVLKKSKQDFNLNVQPFVEIFDAKEYVQQMLKEITQHFYASEYYSSPYHQLCATLGKRIYQKYLSTVRQKTGFINKFRLVYDEYINHVLTNDRFRKNERTKWNEIVHEKFAYMDRSDRPWTYLQMLRVGEFLYDVMLKHMKLRFELLPKQRGKKSNTKENSASDAVLHIVYRTLGRHAEKQVKIHPTVIEFFSKIPQTELQFDCTELPCLSPPMPWLSPSIGGYLLNQTDFVRLPASATEQMNRLRSLPSEKIAGLLDSINTLNSCAWKINKNVLDLLIEVFRKGGNRHLSVPVSVDNARIEEPMPVQKGLTVEEKRRRESALSQARKLKAEVYSLWCNELYRLSIANRFRNEVFWFPHNMDFRGRVYPVPPHFNHLGSDVARSIILFAEGKPLGDDGLRRLKIHLVNLTDLKKKASIDERAKYADEILDEILDSADRPLTGRQWWSKSEEPWQTLACCMEIAQALRSPDPTKYVSHFPVHQDGSCNVLQHYAAMGLDDVGAASVNLKPSELPQDVYSVVVDQVEHERRQDAANGVQIARILEGFVKRKVIKQTIMTTNYGVTMFGARQQIGRQLRDIDEFPKEHVPEASSYLAQKTFLSLRELFRETRRIQDWFTDCASLISRVRGSPVEWNTPMNLPVIQPYYREMSNRLMGSPMVDHFSSFGRPNHIKQKNAFPPNYVHSLDSTHMMLTALQCARNGITFVSVHDSFWTHACDVDQLSQFCREQFIALHREPLLEILSKDFLKKFEFKASEIARSDERQRQTMQLLNDTLKRVPERGTFQLDSVLESKYFFS